MDLSEYDNRLLPPETNDSWRTWLVTGVRRPPVDRRRVRGAHKGIKRMLVEGTGTPARPPYSWKEFSDAMVRQSVGAAVRSLPPRDAHVVKLAYFGGMSNAQIARRLGMSVAAVERRLRDAVGFISRQVEHSRSAGRRALGEVAVWLSGRWLGDATHHLVRAGAVASVALVIATQPAVTVQPGGHPSIRPPRTSASSSHKAPAPAHSAPTTEATSAVSSVPAAGPPNLVLPVALPRLPVKAPRLPTPIQPPLRP